MFPATALGILSLVPAALTLPSWLGSQTTPRDGPLSQVNDRVNQGTDSIFDTKYSNNWAGAALEEGNGTFTYVTGTFTVPTPSGSVGDSAAVWVGIDGDTCQGVILQTGIAFTVESGQPSYTAWVEWFPGPAYNFEGFTISAGNTIKLTVDASSATSGTVTVDNVSTGESASTKMTSSVPLCGENAEWIVEDYSMDQAGNLVPLANFGTVTFTDAEATGPGSETYTPTGAAIYEMVNQNGQVVTSVSMSGSSVTIKYT